MTATGAERPPRTALGEGDPDEHDRAAEVGLLEHEQERHDQDEAGHQQVPERAPGGPSAGQVSAPDEDRGHLASSGRLADLVPPIVQAAPWLLCRARPPSRQQHMPSRAVRNA